MLTSPKNPTIQHIRKLQAQSRYRREQGLFVVEGVRLVGECLLANVRPEIVLHTEEIDDAFLEEFRTRGIGPVPVSAAAMQAASDTETPQGILAVVPIPDFNVPRHTGFLLVLDRLRDPGNVGTILRTAAAAGVEGVLLAPGCADAFQPKVVRAGMGAHFYLPIAHMGWEEIAARTQGRAVFLASAGGSLAYTAADLTQPLVLVIGGEAHGAGPGVEGLALTEIAIPMPGGTESLNAAIAAGILIYEVVRQRAAAP